MIIGGCIPWVSSEGDHLSKEATGQVHRFRGGRGFMFWAKGLGFGI